MNESAPAPAGAFHRPTMPLIRFKAHGANSQLGSFASGDRVRVSTAFARHLVEEARVAEYVTPTPTTTETTAGPRVNAENQPKTKHRRKATAKE